MARLARAVFEGVPHHVTQRGNGKARTFFKDADYGLYRELLAEYSAKAQVKVWGWVLMPNHVHLILVPSDPDGLRRCLAPVHRYYAGHVHARELASGHFWQGRFGCVAMDDAHLHAALRYVALNPVRAKLVPTACDWRWSSIHALRNPHRGDGLTAVEEVLGRCPDLLDQIADGEDLALSQSLRQAETVGRPLGGREFLQQLENRIGRSLTPARRGPKPLPP